MLQKFGLHDNQRKLPCFTYQKIKYEILLRYMYIFSHFLTRSSRTVRHASTSVICSLEVLLLNSSSCKLDWISPVGLVSSSSARMDKEVSTETLNTLELSPGLQCIVAGLEVRLYVFLWTCFCHCMSWYGANNIHKPRLRFSVIFDRRLPVRNSKCSRVQLFSFTARVLCPFFL